MTALALARTSAPTWPERVVAWVAARIGPRPRAAGGGVTRRALVVRFAIFASALAIGPVRFILRPGTAYATVCGPGSTCDSGWTAFCCTINGGRNECPAGSFAAGWWKNDSSSFCGGRPRYIIDCNATCPTSCTCRCAGAGTCDDRKTCCNQFRYGQCHQEIACAGPVVCRVATCDAPWEFDASCGTGSATDNRTSEHGAPCIVGIDDDPRADVFAFGAPDLGSPVGSPLTRPLVGMAGSPTGQGYWLVASDGGIFAYGDAPFLGSTGAVTLNRPIVGMAGTPTGRGYWLVASDGGIFAYGDAPFLGSTGGLRLNRPVVGMTPTPSGRGYWLVASDGGIFAYGDAPFLGSTGGTALNRPVVGIARTGSGRGYWLVAADGGIFTFGDAPFRGSVSAAGLNEGAAVGVARAPVGSTADPDPGYWVVVRRRR